WTISVINAVLFQAKDGIRYRNVTGVQTCALPICILKTIKHLRFENTKERLYHPIIRTIPFPRHGWTNTFFNQKTMVTLMLVLPTLVTMQDSSLVIFFLKGLFKHGLHLH